MSTISNTGWNIPWHDDSARINDNPLAVSVDADLLIFYPLTLRHWQQSDHFNAGNETSGAKLSGFFGPSENSLCNE